MNISHPEPLTVLAGVDDNGRYCSAGEYVRELISDDEKQSRKASRGACLRV